MVFFTCNACGESIKKAQVANHLFKCRRCSVLSCVDCQKDFPGDSYTGHIKCITEAEKYSGKGWKPKASINKGEQKQEAWTEQVVQAIERCKADKDLKQILLRIKDFPNIPRKRAKFVNFLKCNGVRNENEAFRVWDVINSCNSADKVAKEETNDEVNPKLNDENDDETKAETLSKREHKDDVTETKPKELNKRERKEERRKQQQKPQKKHKKTEDDEEPTKKYKKRKHDDIEEEEEEEIEKEKSPKKKKGKKKDAEESDNDDDCENLENESDEAEPKEEKVSGKFDWSSTILTLLEQAEGNEMSLKKLKKKVLSEFQAQGGDGSTFSEDKLMAKFNKKVMKNPKLKIHKERVKLRN